MIGRLKMITRRIPPVIKRCTLVALLIWLVTDLLWIGGLASLFHRADNIRLNYKYSKLPGRPKGQRRIAILTYYSNDAYGTDLRKLTWPNKQKYASAHGYDIYDINSIPDLAARIQDQKSNMHNYFFYKYLSISDAIQGKFNNGKKYDYIIWNDPDALFLNHSRRYEDIIDERFDVTFTTGPPSHPQWGLIVNTGGFIVKNSEFSKGFLEDVLQMSRQHCGEFILENPSAGSALNGWLQVCNSDGGYWLGDQGIVQALFSFKPAEYKCHFKKTWFRAFNSEFPWYGEGDLAVHFPGRALKEKKRLIKALCKFTNFSTGKISKKAIDLIKHETCLTSDLDTIERLYDSQNPTCSKK